MAFDWTHFYTLAKTLHEEPGGHLQEARSRSAVSRAYYAAFCLCRNYARKHFGFPERGSSADHDNLPGCFLDCDRSAEASKIAQDLGRLYCWRNNCDYDDELAASPGVSVFSAAMTTAERTITLLGEIKKARRKTKP